MESPIEKERFKSVKLPLKSINESNTIQQMALIKASLEEYRVLIKTLLDNLSFFFESLNNKYIAEMQFTEKELKIYENFYDLFNFNHFNVKIEIDEFIQKESEIRQSIDSIFIHNSNRSDGMTSKPNFQKAVENNKEIQKLEEKLLQTRKRKYFYKKANKELHEKYVALMKRIENEQSIDNMMRNNEFEFIKIDSIDHRPRSMIFNNSNDNILNNTFEILPNGQTASVEAFNPNISMNAKSVSNYWNKKDSMSNLSHLPSNKSISADKIKSKSRKKDIYRLESERQMLNKEIVILKQELKEEKMEKKFLIEKYEKTARV